MFRVFSFLSDGPQLCVDELHDLGPQIFRILTAQSFKRVDLVGWEVSPKARPEVYGLRWRLLGGALRPAGSPAERPTDVLPNPLQIRLLCVGPDASVLSGCHLDHSRFPPTHLVKRRPRRWQMRPIGHT